MHCGVRWQPCQAGTRLHRPPKAPGIAWHQERGIQRRAGTKAHALTKKESATLQGHRAQEPEGTQVPAG